MEITSGICTLSIAERQGAFSQQIFKSDAAMGWNESPTLVAREFNLRWRGTIAVVHAVRKWMLGVSQDWLRWGVMQGTAVSEGQPFYIKQPRPEGSSVQSLTQDVRLLTESHIKLVQALVSAMLVEQKQKVTAGGGE
jgi:hypothetical protein